MLSFYKHFHLESHIIRYRIGRKFCKPNHRMSNMFSEYWILFKALFVYQYFNFTGKYTLNITVTMNLLRAKEASHHRVTHTNLVQLLGAKTEKVTLFKITSAKGGLAAIGTAKIGLTVRINRKWHWNIKLEWLRYPPPPPLLLDQNGQKIPLCFL